MNVPCRILAIGLLAAIVGLMEAPQVLTCSCTPPPPPKQSPEQSAAVFSAKVIKIEDEDAPSTSRRVTLKVERWWKGGDAATITVATQKSGATCGFGFQPDTHYLVYAHNEKGRKEFVVSLCSRTRTLAQADQSGDLKELGKGKAPPKK
jgi:hypothetical protein